MRSAGEFRIANMAFKLDSIMFRLDMSLEVGVETCLVAALVTGVSRCKVFTLGVCLQSSVSSGGIITGITFKLS